MGGKRPSESVRGKRAIASPELKAFITWALVAIVLIIITLTLSRHWVT